MLPSMGNFGTGCQKIVSLDFMPWSSIARFSRHVFLSLYFGGFFISWQLDKVTSDSALDKIKQSFVIGRMRRERKKPRKIRANSCDGSVTKASLYIRQPCWTPSIARLITFSLQREESHWWVFFSVLCLCWLLKQTIFVHFWSSKDS